MAKAETSDEREEAKKHLIYVIVAIVGAIALIVFFNTLLPMILSACGMGVINDEIPSSGGSPTETLTTTALALKTFRLIS